MVKFTVEITETLQRQIEIEADNSVDAAIIAKQKYRNGEIVLTSEDYVDTEIRAIQKTRNRNYKER